MKKNHNKILALMFSSKRISTHNTQSGFTLLELIIVLVIAAVVFTPLYLATIHTVFSESDRKPIAQIKTALAEHVRVYGDLPCPAPLGLARTDPGYSTGDCKAARTVASGKVHIGAVPAKDLRRALGCAGNAGAGSTLTDKLVQTRLFDISTLIDAGFSTAPDRRASGLVKTQCIQDRQMLDEHGNKFIYAVADGARNMSTYTEAAARQIRIVNKNGQPATKDRQKFVLVQLGNDREGGYTASGRASISCQQGLDTENCDGDAVFRNMQLSSVSGQQQYDDSLYFSLAGYGRENSMWEWRGPVGGSRTISMGQNARMLIGSSAIEGTENDRLVVNGGNMRMGDGKLEMKAPNIMKSNIIRLENNSTTLESDNQFSAPQFCYENGDMFGPDVGCK